MLVDLFWPLEVIEASTGRCNGKVCRNVYPLSAMLARGFVPVRYRGLAPATVADSGQPAPPAAPEQPAGAKKPADPKRVQP